MSRRVADTARRHRVALLLALPSLLSPLSMDEHVQAIRWRAVMEHPEGGGVTGFLNDCFVFASGDEMANRREIQDGLEVDGNPLAIPEPDGA